MLALVLCTARFACTLAAVAAVAARSTRAAARFLGLTGSIHLLVQLLQLLDFLLNLLQVLFRLLERFLGLQTVRDRRATTEKSHAHLLVVLLGLLGVPGGKKENPGRQ